MVPYEHENEQMMCGKGINEIPIEEKKSYSFKENGRRRIVNLLRIISKLALIDGYNEEGNIRSSDGSFIKTSDIAQLLLHAMSPGKVLFGENEFIELLKKANVDPMLILNENVRRKLLNNQSTYEFPKIEPQLVVERTEPPKAQNKKYEPDIITVNTPNREENELSIEEEIEEPRTLRKAKRRFENIQAESENSSPKKRKNDFPDNWIVARD